MEQRSNEDALTCIAQDLRTDSFVARDVCSFEPKLWTKCARIEIRVTVIDTRDKTLSVRASDSLFTLSDSLLQNVTQTEFVIPVGHPSKGILMLTESDNEGGHEPREHFAHARNR